MTVTLDAARILDSALALGWPAVLAFVRIGAMMALLPVLSEVVVPARVRLALALALTPVVAPFAAAAAPDPHPAALVAEAAAGLALGAVLRLMLQALQMAGAMTAQATSLAQMFPGSGPEPLPAIGHLLTVAGLALFVALDGPVRAVQLLLLSYEAMPPGALPRPADLAMWLLDRSGLAIALAFQLAAPFLAASLIYTVALGVMNRAMPSLMLTLVGAPAQAAGMLVLTLAILPLALGVWRGGLEAALDAPLAVR